MPPGDPFHDGDLGRHLPADAGSAQARAVQQRREGRLVLPEVLVLLREGEQQGNAGLGILRPAQAGAQIPHVV